MFLKTYIALFLYALTLATTPLNAACITEAKMLSADFKQALTTAQNLLERVKEFDGYNLVVLQNIKRDLNALSKEVPMPAMVRRIFAAPVNQLSTLAKQLLQENENRYVLSDYLLFFMSLYCMECLTVEKVELYYTLREEKKADQYYRKYLGIKKIMPTLFSNQTNNKLTALYNQSSKAYLDFREASALSCNMLREKLSLQDKNHKNYSKWLCKSLAKRLNFLAKAKL